MLSTNFLSGGGSKGDGVNLLTGTKDFSGGGWTDLDSQYWADDGEYNGLKVKTRLGDFKNFAKEIAVTPGQYTFSFYIKANASANIFVYSKASGDSPYIGKRRYDIGNTGEEWKRFSLVIDVLDTAPPDYTLELSIANTTTNGQIWLAGYKLERGIVTDPVWTPAPEDVLLKGEVDGRNLFVMATATKGMFIEANGTERPASEFNNEKTSDYISVFANKEISVRMRITSVNDWPYWIAVIWYDSEKRHISGDIFTIREIMSTFSDVSTVFTAPFNAAYFRVTARFYNDGRIKVERGSVATDWTPAPEDVVVRSELEALVARVAALEKQVGISSDESEDDLEMTSLSTKGGDPL